MPWPDDVWLGRVQLAATLVQAGREEEAHAVAEAIMRLNPKFSAAKYVKSRLYKDPQLKQELLTALRTAGLPD